MLSQGEPARVSAGVEVVVIYGMSLAAFAALPLEARIRLAASDYLGWRYGSPNSFPNPRPGLPTGLVVPGRTSGVIDCSSFGSYVLITATPAGRWDAARYGELQIFDAKAPWSPLDAVERAGVGVKVAEPVVGGWHVCQAWVDDRLDDGDPLDQGHFRLVRAMTADSLLVLESTSREGIGPRWSLVTLVELRKRYPAGVRLAHIRG